jgi:hypothetical protein
VRRLVLVLVAACGDDATMTPRDGGGDATAPPDAPAPPDAAGFPRQGGLVSITLNEPAASVSLNVGFWKTSAAGEGCALNAEGPCSTTICGDASGIMAVSAGDVTATAAASMLLAQPGADAQYGFPSAAAADFPPGGAVAVVAAGADVPAFSHDLVMAAPVAVLEPTTALTTVRRTEPFVARWTPGEGDVYVYLSNTFAGPVYPITIGTTLRCVVPSSLGELTVPGSLVADLAPGAGSVAVTGIDEARVNLGEIEVQVRTVATNFAIGVTFE